MNTELITIQTDLQAGGLNPHKAAEYKMKVAGWYSFITGEVEEILARRPAIVNVTACYCTYEKGELVVNPKCRIHYKVGYKTK